MSEWNSALYDTKHGFVSQFGQSLIELLAPQKGERILDLGCGTGQLANQIAQSGATVVGMDNSADMIAAAKRVYPQIAFYVADATRFSAAKLSPTSDDCQQKFDAIFSNAALHWVRPPERAAACMSRALRRGGRLVLEMGGAGNIAAIIAATRKAIRQIAKKDVTPVWYFPSLAEYSALLEAHGFEVTYAWLFDRPTPLVGEDGMLNWFRMFGGGLFGGVELSLIDKICVRAERDLRPKLYVNGQWVADYRRLRIVARKK